MYEWWTEYDRFMVRCDFDNVGNITKKIFLGKQKKNSCVQGISHLVTKSDY